ncbi:monocarboxylate transporter 13-like [Amphiura filiformis]|uniref:monocarboxylate transporter 13-like n=1 Tax=Amphiura filiformis TaxID=82378 RepID=UPI003B213322
MGYGQHRQAGTLTKSMSSTSNFQHQQQSSSPGVETMSAASLPRVVSRSNLPAELQRRSSSHRRSIYSIDFDIEKLQKDDSTSDTTPSAKHYPSPDGGYGWVVVIAVHIIQALSIGFLTSLGIFFIEWREYFDASATRVGLAVSMSSLVLGITSPLAVGITGIIGSRPLVMSGTLVVFVGLLATSYATSITQLTFTVGVISAFGYGMISSSSILAIVDYFDGNFALANGIAFSGASIGQLIYPPMSVEFIDWFGGWRGAMFVISALSLNMAVCGALLRPVKKVRWRSKTEENQQPH